MRLFTKYLQKWVQKRRACRVTYECARQRVQRGAAYLDDIDPTWYWQVDPMTLELSSGRSCVLGQLHGDFRRGLARSRLINLSSAPRISLSPISYGFKCVDDVSEELQAQDYAYLNRAWCEAIRQRREADEHATPRAVASSDRAPEAPERSKNASVLRRA